MSFKIGDLVWGKMKGFPPWPGLISEPPNEMKKSMKGNIYCVYFFGSKNYSWLDEKGIKPYADMKAANIKAYKTASFVEACKEIEDYISSGASGLPVQKQEVVEVKKEKKESKKRISETKSDDKVSAKKKKDSTLPKTPSNSSNDIAFSTPKSLSKRIKITSLDSSILDNRDLEVFKSPQANLINRPYLGDPEIPVTDVKQCESIKSKNITPSTKVIGFLGLGIMGSRIAKSILQSGHKLMIWNRTPEKCDQFIDEGAEVGMTPADVVQKSDIIFCCVSNPVVVKSLVMGNCGVVSELNPSKGYVELSAIDVETSKEIDTIITSKGSRYLEVQMLGSMNEAEEGKLVLLCAGDKTLFDDSLPCLNAASQMARFVGPIGSAIELYLVYQVIRNINIGAVAEIFSFAKALNIPLDIFIEILQSIAFGCPLFDEKLKFMLNEKFVTSQPLQYAQKDLTFALNFGDKLKQSLPLTAALNESFKHARRLGLGTHDTSSLYFRDLKY